MRSIQRHGSCRPIRPALARMMCAALAAIASLTGQAARAQSWEAVTQPIGDFVASQPFVEGAGLLVMRHDEVLREQYWGTYDKQTQLNMASASKLLAAIAIMSLVDDGLLDLDALVSSYLPAEFPAGTAKGGMTVRQMFSHTAGLPGQSQFVANSGLTLAQAVALIGQNTPLIANPGDQFSYGGVSMHVAGRVAEVVAGQPWKVLFAERVVQPLGLTATDWNAFGVTENPRIAGGARSSVRDYQRVLAMLLSDGMHEGSVVLSPESVATILSDQTNGAAVAFVPNGLEDYLGYGIGAWIELTNADTGTPLEFTSPGAFGTTPWINPEAEIIGILVIDASLGGVDEDTDAIRAFARSAAAGNPCAADLTRSGAVDSGDLGVLLGAFGQSDAGDLNADGITDTTDLGILLAAFGTNCQ